MLHPGESPESNGMAEAFVKTFKRGYVRVSPIQTRGTFSLSILVEGYGTVHLHSRLGYRSPGSAHHVILPTRHVSGLRSPLQFCCHSLIRKLRNLVSDDTKLGIGRRATASRLAPARTYASRGGIPTTFQPCETLAMATGSAVIRLSSGERG